MKVNQKLPRVNISEGRKPPVINRCQGKRVLHVGCVDTYMLHERIGKGELLHQKLSMVADDLWGADINAEGIQVLQDAGFDKLYVSDASSIGDVPGLQNQVFDVIVATELMEHLSNPGLFLDSILKLMTPGHTELVVSVPNAFKLRVLYRLFTGVEWVHPDHNYWYSHYTITNLLKKHGYKISQTQMYLTGDLPKTSLQSIRERLTKPPQLARHILGIPWRALTYMLYKMVPYFGDGIIVVAIVEKD